jgi:hypothetical protein
MIAANSGSSECYGGKITASFLVPSSALPVSGDSAVHLTHDALISDPCLDSYQMQGVVPHLYLLFLVPS